MMEFHRARDGKMCRSVGVVQSVARARKILNWSKFNNNLQFHILFDLLIIVRLPIVTRGTPDNLIRLRQVLSSAFGMGDIADGVADKQVRWRFTGRCGPTK